MNNAHLKLNSMSEFTALWNSGERFRKFAEQVYRYLERMKPGTVLVLERYSGEQLEWIIKTACVFILEGNNSLEYEFNEDYTAVVHRHVDPDVKKWILSRCKHECRIGRFRFTTDSRFRRTTRT